MILHHALSLPVIASEAKQSIERHVTLWIASSHPPSPEGGFGGQECSSQ
jgi:hypothetical protein